MDLFRENKKIKYKKTNDKPIGSLLNSFLKANGLEKKFLSSKAIHIYKENMGPVINSFTEKIYVHKKIIYIYINSAALKQEIRFSKDKIKNFINEELDFEYIKDVVIR